MAVVSGLVIATASDGDFTWTTPDLTSTLYHYGVIKIMTGISSYK